MILLSLLGCMPDLLDTYDWDDGEPVDTSDTGIPPLVTLVPEGEGWRMEVDASDGILWAAVDLDAAMEVSDADPGWDLRFQRFHMSVNGGVSGEGGVEAVFAPGQSLDGPLTVPTSGWRVDEPDGDDDGADPDYALFEWYDYDPETHVLTPRPGVWYVRSTEGAVFALQITTYYDAVGSSGHPQLAWVGPLASSEE